MVVCPGQSPFHFSPSIHGFRQLGGLVDEPIDYDAGMIKKKYSEEFGKLKKQYKKLLEKALRGKKNGEYRACAVFYFFPQWVYDGSGRVLPGKRDCLQRR
jgi:hypothetical protein